MEENRQHIKERKEPVSVYEKQLRLALFFFLIIFYNLQETIQSSKHAS